MKKQTVLFILVLTALTFGPVAAEACDRNHRSDRREEYRSREEWYQPRGEWDRRRECNCEGSGGWTLEEAEEFLADVEEVRREIDCRLGRPDTWSWAREYAKRRNYNREPYQWRPGMAQSYREEVARMRDCLGLPNYRPRPGGPVVMWPDWRVEELEIALSGLREDFRKGRGCMP